MLFRSVGLWLLIQAIPGLARLLGLVPLRGQAVGLLITTLAALGLLALLNDRCAGAASP